MKVFAHRGFSGKYPENTRLAFDQAHELGVDGFELDVQLSADNKIVVFHDRTLERTTNGKGRLGDHTLLELKQYDAGQGEQIPALAELLKTYYLGPQLMIELKYPTASNYQPLIEALVKLLKRFKLKYPPIICSFNWPALVYLRNKNQALNIAVLHRHKPFTRVLQIAKMVKACAISTNIDEVNCRKVAATKAAGLKMYAWTVNTKKQASFCCQLGIFGIISNFPNEVRP
ncbi:MAG: glycerophosphodiester phosphodiesterase family protein [bacterium]|nr:glycerophosphodiester phosphodiesterase family protein [bacterium]